MKRNFKRIVAALLFLCIVATLLPPAQITRAAEAAWRYELDTDGIDPGATYLIVNNSSAGSAHALKFYYSSSWSRDFRDQTLTIQTEDGVTFIETGFSGESDCQFQFSAANSGKITHGSYAVDLSGSRFVNGNPSNTLTFKNEGNGKYQIYYSSSWRSTYLRYYNNDWSNTTTATSVFLFKLTEHVIGYDITFDGNGYTSGQLPADSLMLSAGEEFIVPAPTKLRKDIGEDTWLFQCWNTAPDASGVEYAPGDKIIVSEDLVLYADWYQQTKHTISMITYLDNVATDVDKFAGYDRHFYAVLDGGDGTYIPMTRSDEGTYTAKVPDNGTYIIHAITAEGEYEPVHGHKIVVFNQAGTTECLHYTVSYDLAGGAWAEGEEPAAEKHHSGETMTVTQNQPTRDGYRFVGWVDQDSITRHPGHPVTVDKKIVLTAQWEKLVDVTVNVVIDHNGVNGGSDNAATMHDVTFLLLREENGANLPVEEKSLTGGTYDSATNKTTYTVVFQDLPQGTYHAASTKSNYETEITHGENHTININLQYAPSNFDLFFDVKVNMDKNEESLKPIAVNVKVSYWGYDENDNLGWHIITQQEGHHAPTTVTIDENGNGTGFFPVWKNWSDGVHAYEYRVEVTSFVLPDNTIVPASGNLITYTPDGSGLYTATVTVDSEGRKPSYPDGSETELTGAYFANEKQNGAITVTVDVNPMTVTFLAGDGTVNGEEKIILENQYRYPALHDYVAVPNDSRLVFIGWEDENGNLAENLEETLLPGNVTYTAVYNENFTVSGNVAADAVYELDGRIFEVPEYDRLEKVMVVLQKKIGDIYNDVDSVETKIVYQMVEGYDHLIGIGGYTFEELPNDGIEYRIQILALNYNDKYDRYKIEEDRDELYTKEEAVVLVDATTTQTYVDVHLDFVPEAYEQAIFVDASRIHADLRPDGALAQILYRNLGDVHNFNIISQHTQDPYGVMMDLSSSTATAMDTFEVWNWHTNGTLYEYQMQIGKVYGNVIGAYTVEGLEYNADRPYTVEYGAPNNYLKQNQQGGFVLEARLVPKQYPIYLDLNLEGADASTVYGLEQYMVDDGTGNERFLYVHTWSFADEFTAYPYREGYVFTGWEAEDDNDVYIKDGTIYIGNTLDHSITLTAKWEKLNETDYTIRYLELNTDKVLRGAKAVTGAMLGETIVAAEKAAAIEGYAYAGAYIDGVYMDKAENPAMTITNDPVRNLMVIYYLPDGSDGYTEQVESNLEIDKEAVLEKDGTYTITMSTYTKDNPITTLIQQNTPLDIVMVLDQSASIIQGGYLDELKSSVDNFVSLVASHGRNNEVDHRIAIVGYAGSETSQAYANTIAYPIAGGDAKEWVNTGVFDSNGDFHPITVTGFNYTPFEGVVDRNGIYYTYSEGEYLLLTYHDRYYHLITAEEARIEALNGTTVYGYVDGGFVALTRNSSGLWLYGDKQLYSLDKYFTFHENVWTHRKGTDRRQIHGYTVNGEYKPADNHQGLYVREETKNANPQLNVYKDALVPVSVGANGSGGVNPGLKKATSYLGSNGQTYVQYGMEMANRVFAENPLTGADADRIRIVVVFTDGMPGAGTFDEETANAAIEQSYIAKNDHDAYVYTVGLYPSDGINATDDEGYFMNGLSSNYPQAHDLDDVRTTAVYSDAVDGYPLNAGGPYYVNVNGTYYELTTKISYSNKKYWYCWGYEGASGRVEIYQTNDVAQMNPDITGGMVGDYKIYKKAGGGYQATPYSGYYSTTDSEGMLQQYFANIVAEITTKVTTNIILHEDTILRDIMGRGLVLTPGAVVTAYKQKGVLEDGEVTWSENLEYVASATVPEGNPKVVKSKEETTVSYVLDNGTNIVKENVPFIQIYNLDSKNATNPDGNDYHPHTVDVTGYDFEEWYISDTHTEGYKMVVTITGIEARDDVKWGVSTNTNNAESGLWLPADENGNRQLLLPFDQPTTIFVERAYVLDYGKEFTLNGWYFDDEDGKNATPIHLDCDITDGMNRFDPELPNTANSKTGSYGNTKYGNVQVKKDGTVTYTPTTMNWGGYDQFYVFGQTWRKTVLAQDANANGVPEDKNLANLWNKVTVIPANNIYYEDSFITTENTEQNGIEGFIFSKEGWSVEGTDSGNTEIPEHLESAPYGDVHGWTDSLGDDTKFTDGSAHVTGLNGEIGATAEFTFTGTGVEVYTVTNANSGVVIAALYQQVKDGSGQEELVFQQSLAMDNQSVYGEFYQIPTVSFTNLPYGTYNLLLVATVAENDDLSKRYEYYIDGIRVYNPLGNTTNYQSDVIKYAYGLETNAVFTEIRDILLKYKDFNVDMPDGTDGKMGAVFIDQIKPGQESGNDQAGTGKPTYEISTFESFGPKNEVYLSKGQAIVLKVAEGNTYYVGLKSLNGKTVTVNVSGIDQADPTAITVKHTADMYYQVTPVDGYIVIQNANTDEALLAITTLRTTNLTAPAPNGGILSVGQQEVLEIINEFSDYMLEKENEAPQPVEPEEMIPSVEEQTQEKLLVAKTLFTSVRQWLGNEEEE